MNLGKLGGSIDFASCGEKRGRVVPFERQVEVFIKIVLFNVLAESERIPESAASFKSLIYICDKRHPPLLARFLGVTRASQLTSKTDFNEVMTQLRRITCFLHRRSPAASALSLRGNITVEIKKINFLITFLGRDHD